MKAMIPGLSRQGLLSLTKAQFQSKYPPSLRFDNITVGAIIFKRIFEKDHKLLLLKRASHDTAFPNQFEIPGGHLEDTDQSMEHGLKREVLEETSLKVQNVVDQIDSLPWVTERSVFARSVHGKDSIFTREIDSLQINFVCDVESECFKVDQEEHSMGVWADREEAARFDISWGMRMVVSNAFSWRDDMVKRGLKI